MPRPRSNFSRRLRITFSAACLFVSLPIVLLWVRSYWRTDIYMSATFFETNMIVSSHHGLASVKFEDWSRAMTMPYGLNTDPAGWISPLRKRNFGLVRLPGVTSLWFPYWSVFLPTILLAAAPWLPWHNRFSLRYLMLSVMIVALLLAAVVYMVR